MLANVTGTWMFCLTGLHKKGRKMEKTFSCVDSGSQLLISTTGVLKYNLFVCLSVCAIIVGSRQASLSITICKKLTNQTNSNNHSLQPGWTEKHPRKPELSSERIRRLKTRSRSSYDYTDPNNQMLARSELIEMKYPVHKEVVQTSNHSIQFNPILFL